MAETAQNPDTSNNTGNDIVRFIEQSAQNVEQTLATLFPSNVDLPGFRAAAGVVNRNAAQLEAVFRSVIENNAQIYKDRETNLRAIQAIEQAETALRVAADAKSQQQNSAAATAFGVNQDAVNEVITALGATSRNITERIIKRSEKIHQNTQVPTMLGKVVGTLQNEFLREFNNADASELNITTQAMQRLNQAAQAQITTNNAIRQTLDSGSVARATELAALKANEAIAVLRQQAVKDNLINLEAAFKVSKEQLNTMFQIASLENQAIDNQRQAEVLELQRKTHNLQFQKLQKDIEQEKVREDDVNIFVDTVNKGRAIMGLPAMNRREIEQYTRMGGAAKIAIEQQYESGALVNSTGVRNIAPDPANSALRLRQSNVVVQGPQSKIQEQINQAFSDVLADPTLSAADKNKPEIITAAVNKMLLKGDPKKGVQGLIRIQAENIKPGDTTNIYQAPAAVDIVKAAAVQSTPLFSAILEPQVVKAGITDISPKDLISRTASAVLSGALSMQDAIDGITIYYKQAALLNNQVMDYSKYGLPRQESYNTVVSSGYAGSSKYNLMDSTQVATLMSRALVQARIQGLSTGIGTFGLPITQ